MFALMHDFRTVVTRR